MFRHFMHEGERRGCGPRHFEHFARFGGRHEHFERGVPGGRERMFDSGELQLVILYLLAEQPSYGYQLIKTMEQRLAGGYAPSPGVIYPTLTLLEEEGFATASTSEAGKKVYTVTEEGRKHLEANKRQIEEILARLEHAGQGFQRGRAPDIMRAFMNLRGAVKSRVTRPGLNAEQLKKIAEAINNAAKAIDEL